MMDCILNISGINRKHILLLTYSQLFFHSTTYLINKTQGLEIHKSISIASEEQRNVLRGMKIIYLRRDAHLILTFILRKSHSVMRIHFSSGKSAHPNRARGVRDPPPSGFSDISSVVVMLTYRTNPLNSGFYNANSAHLSVLFGFVKKARVCCPPLKPLYCGSEKLLILCFTFYTSLLFGLLV